jgi:hypothetical protein
MIPSFGVGPNSIHTQNQDGDYSPLINTLSSLIASNVRFVALISSIYNFVILD